MTTTATKPGKTYGQKVQRDLEERQAELARLKAEKEAKAAEPSQNKAAAKAREKRAKRTMYPGLQPNEDGNATVKLQEWPADFDEKLHIPLTRKNFVNEAPWLLNRAEKAERLAASLREQASLAVKFGNAADRAKAKKLKHMASVVGKLSAELAAQGIDVAALMGDEEQQ